MADRQLCGLIRRVEKLLKYETAMDDHVRHRLFGGLVTCKPERTAPNCHQSCTDQTTLRLVVGTHLIKRAAQRSAWPQLGSTAEQT